MAKPKHTPTPVEEKLPSGNTLVEAGSLSIDGKDNVHPFVESVPTSVEKLLSGNTCITY